MSETTISLKEETKDDLEGLKLVDGETYDSVVKRLVSDGRENTDAPSDGHDIETIVDRLRDDLSTANNPDGQLDGERLFTQLDTLEGRLKDLETQVESLRSEVQSRR